MSLSFRALITAAIMGILSLGEPSLAAAQDETTAPPHVETSLPFKEVGSGTYRRFGFSVYQATLWAVGDGWNPHKPFLLELHYVRDVSKDVLVESIIDDIREQNAADDDEIGKWQHTLADILPDVQEGDTLSGLSVPGAKTKIFRNGREIATLDDELLSRAFFNMWFGDHADPDLRKELLGTS
jgi:hypothetical protein